MRRPARPGPAPVIPSAGRLEAVRAHTGFPSLRSFWGHLAEGWTEGGVSYEAARNYHYDREPPVAYVRRIVERFPEIRLEWLVSGSGPMTREEEEGQEIQARMVRERAQAERWERVPGLICEALGIEAPSDPGRSLPLWLSGAVALWSSRRLAGWHRFFVHRRGEGDKPDEEELARAVGRALLAPLEALGLHPGDLDRNQFQDYALTMVAALAPVADIRPEEDSNG